MLLLFSFHCRTPRFKLDFSSSDNHPDTAWYLHIPIHFLRSFPVIHASSSIFEGPVTACCCVVRCKFDFSTSGDRPHCHCLPRIKLFLLFILWLIIFLDSSLLGTTTRQHVMLPVYSPSVSIWFFPVVVVMPENDVSCFVYRRSLTAHCLRFWIDISTLLWPFRRGKPTHPTRVQSSNKSTPTLVSPTRQWPFLTASWTISSNALYSVYSVSFLRTFAFDCFRMLTRRCDYMLSVLPRSARKMSLIILIANLFQFSNRSTPTLVSPTRQWLSWTASWTISSNGLYFVSFLHIFSFDCFLTSTHRWTICYLFYS